MSDFAGGKAMKYPYSTMGKFVNLNWSYLLKNSSVFRLYGYSVLICLPMFMFIDKKVNMTENHVIWDAKRKNRIHDPFPTLDHRKDL